MEWSGQEFFFGGKKEVDYEEWACNVTAIENDDDNSFSESKQGKERIFLKEKKKKRKIKVQQMGRK